MRTASFKTSLRLRLAPSHRPLPGHPQRQADPQDHRLWFGLGIDRPSAGFAVETCTHPRATSRMAPAPTLALWAEGSGICSPSLSHTSSSAACKHLDACRWTTGGWVRLCCTTPAAITSAKCQDPRMLTCTHSTNQHHPTKHKHTRQTQPTHNLGSVYQPSHLCSRRGKTTRTCQTTPTSTAPAHVPQAARELRSDCIYI